MRTFTFIVTLGLTCVAVVAIAASPTSQPSETTSQATCTDGSCGMCVSKGTAISEEQARQRASIFGQKRFAIRQSGKNPMLDELGRPLPASVIDSKSWDVAQRGGKWRLKRHLTRDLWQVLECDADGSGAIAIFEVAPTTQPVK